ncbi:MAG: PadR family transcriptional regulator [Kosmotogaceae bacterium]
MPIKKKFHNCHEGHHKNYHFLKVCLLVLLNEKTSHGYSLMNRLPYFGFEPKTINTSTIYRTLRSMEKDNIVKSIWKESEQGPKKRVYKITQEGKKELESWMNFLKIRKNQIDKVLSKYESSNEEKDD